MSFTHFLISIAFVLAASNNIRPTVNPSSNTFRTTMESSSTTFNALQQKQNPNKNLSNQLDLSSIPSHISSFDGHLKRSQKPSQRIVIPQKTLDSHNKPCESTDKNVRQPQRK